MAKQLQVVVDAKSSLGEGPIWLADDNKILWVDILGKMIHLFTPKTGMLRTIRTEQYVGTVVPTNRRKLLCAMHHGLYFLDLKSECLEPIADPEEGLPDNRFNDGKCDTTGRFWAGTMSMKGQAKAGALYCLDCDLSLRKAIDGVSISNGIGWSPDNKVMYYIDTPTREVAQFSFQSDNGEISNRKIALIIPDDTGVPDGMTVDSEGMIWVAHWGGSRVTRWNPITGKQLDQVDLPVSQVTSCCFGGANLDVLFITTARSGLTEEQLMEQPLAGGLFAIKLEVSGLPTNRFNI